MLPIFWRRQASSDLAAIVRFISNESPLAARRIRHLIEASVLPVAEHSYLYRTGVVPGTREIISHPNYLVVYRVTAERIEVVNVLHVRQEYP